MSQIPPMSAPPPAYLPPPPRQSNVLAIISLITGILSCLPGMSVLAVALGIAGLLKSNKPNVGGKGMAIAGLILGVVGLAWTVGFVFVAIKGGQLYIAGRPAREAAQQFATDVGQNNADAALKDCSTSIDAEKVRAALTQGQAWGALQPQGTRFIAIPVHTGAGSQTFKVAGLAVFAAAREQFSATVDQENGVYRVTDFKFIDQK